jgi:hypothetical protein
MRLPSLYKVSKQRLFWNARDGTIFKETSTFKHRSVDKKHVFLHVKFEGALSVSFTNKLGTKK